MGDNNGKDSSQGMNPSFTDPSSQGTNPSLTDPLVNLLTPTINTNPSPSIVHTRHPLYLHPSDLPGSYSTTHILTGIDDYTMWSRALRAALIGRNKLGFVTGTCRRDSYAPPLDELWDQCDAVVYGWIMNSVSKQIAKTIIYTENAFLVWTNLKKRYCKVNHARTYELLREIILTRQGLDSVSVYFTKLTVLWAEYDAACALPYVDGIGFDKHVEQKSNERLWMFMMGLNDNYSGLKSNLLLREVLPSIDQAYNLLLQEESQLTVSSSIASRVDYVAGNASANSDKPKGSQNLECTFCKKKGHLVERCFSKGCEFCKKKGHVKDICFKYKEFLKNKGVGGKANIAAAGGCDNMAESSNGGKAQSDDSYGNITFTSGQFERFLETMGHATRPAPVANAGKAAVDDARANTAGPLKWEGLGDWK